MLIYFWGSWAKNGELKFCKTCSIFYLFYSFFKKIKIVNIKQLKTGKSRYLVWKTNLGIKAISQRTQAVGSKSVLT